MFERFTDQARSVVLGAQAEARSRSAPTVRSEHLLATLLSGPDSVASATLLRAGVDPAVLLRTVRALPEPAATSRPSTDDGQALAALGIDLDEVRRQVEQSFGPGALERTRAAGGGPSRHLRLDRSARKVLELSLREAARLRHRAMAPSTCCSPCSTRARGTPRRCWRPPASGSTTPAAWSRTSCASALPAECRRPSTAPSSGTTMLFQRRAGRSAGMGDIGTERREVEFEPLEQPPPAHPTPAAPVPEPEPARR